MTYYIGMCGVVVAYLFTFSGFLKASRNNQSSLVRSYIAPYQKGLIPGKTKCPILCSRANRASNVSWWLKCFVLCFSCLCCGELYIWFVRQSNIETVLSNHSTDKRRP